MDLFEHLVMVGVSTLMGFLIPLERSPQLFLLKTFFVAGQFAHLIRHIRVSAQVRVQETLAGVSFERNRSLQLEEFDTHVPDDRLFATGIGLQLA